jgi:hypothetical protein
MLRSTVAEVADRLACADASPFPEVQPVGPAVAARSALLAVQVESEACRLGRQPKQQAALLRAVITLA